MIQNDNANKRTVVDGVSFFITGSVADFQHIIDGYLLKKHPPKELKIDVGAFVADKGVVYVCGCGDGEFWMKFADPVDAMGSGAPYAMTAMDCGLSAIEAVKMAAKRDTGTGGKIRHYKVK